MGNRNNCLICGKELVYINESKPMKCLYCKREFLSNTSCEDGHYICDECHASPAGKIISRYCLESKSQNPFEIAVALMKHPSVNMHGQSITSLCLQF